VQLPARPRGLRNVRPSPFRQSGVPLWTQSDGAAILRLVEPRGAYTAERAAALSGVPKSTVHYWARQEILVPSVSPERVKLWSYGDLMALRTIYWLRQTKQDASGREVPRTAMKAVRRALREIAALKLDLWTEDGAPRVAVDRRGGIIIEDEGRAQRPGGQRILDADMLDLLAPFASREGLRGPDLSVPRPRLRIVPGKLGGSPHVVRTRLESQALGALAEGGLPKAKICRLYPDIEPEAIDDALDLERQLAQNLHLALAA
jgi:uncharacterized protein (DUF433 family)